MKALRRAAARPPLVFAGARHAVTAAAIVLVLAYSPRALSAELLPYVSFLSTTFTEPAPIESVSNDWEPPFVGGDFALTRNRFELGAIWRNWQFGIVERYDYFLEFAPDTAELIYATKNRLALSPGRTFGLFIDLQESRSYGVRVGTSFTPLSTLEVGLAISYLQSTKYTNGHVSGSAVALDVTDYDFDFGVDYEYSRDVLFGRQVDAPTGSGYTVDLTLDWRPTENFSLRADLYDVISDLRWDAIPYTVATATSDTKTFDEQGYVRYDPAVSGFESFRSSSRELPHYFLLAGRYRFSERLVGIVELEDFEIARFESFGVGWSHSQRHRFEALVNVTTRGLRFRYLFGQLELEMALDRAQTDRVRYRDLSLTYQKRL